ncbi:MAG: hypothetical protein ACXAEF_13300 [Candidatus Thorarchaeota archaeon]|jgi:hypothetical protein
MSLDRSSDSHVHDDGCYDWQTVYLIQSDHAGDKKSGPDNDSNRTSTNDPWVSVHDFFWSFERQIRILFLIRELEEEIVPMEGCTC